MKVYWIRIIVAIFVVLLSLEARAADQNLLVKFILQHTQQRYAPDRRTAVFNIAYKKTKTGIVLFGEVDTLAAKISLIATLRKNIKGEIIDSISVLPDTAVGSLKNGIIIIDVGNIIDRPRKRGRLTTQALMGTVVTLLKKVRGYYLIQMPDKYLGWIDTASLTLANQDNVAAWNIAHKVIITELKCIVRKAPDSSSLPLFSVVAGCILKKIDQNDRWAMVELANGQNGFIQDSFVQDLCEWEKSRILNGENLEKTAKLLLRIPYVWGGTSVKGMDCSGFIKTVYRLNGMELQRDADQQAYQGTEIDPGKEFDNLQRGDLLFFSSRKKGKQSRHITHVGLSLGKGLFIHSSISKRVRLSSLDSSSTYFEKSLRKQFVLARRIIRE
jgi:gamma-D-glutamyl-L-lysine dipeptidyl-peptidase